MTNFPEYAATPANRSPSAVPVPKVAAATVAASLATVVVVAIQAASGWDAPVGLEGALATVFAFLAGYLTPPRYSA